MEDFRVDDEIIFTYGDSTLYSSDLNLLEKNRWINDRIIGFYFEYLENEIKNMPDNKNKDLKLIFVHPSVMMMINVLSLDVLKEDLAGLGLSEVDMALIPVNNKTDLEEEIGGSHWSLLVWLKKENSFWAFDSAANANNFVMNQVASKFAPLVGLTGIPKIETMRTPHQTNGYDCGMYVLTIALFVATHQRYCQEVEQITHLITPAVVKKQRKDITDLIKKLKDQEDKKLK